MKAFETNPMWLVMAVFYALIHDSLNCTFRSVTDDFSASLKGTYNVTTEQECLSKCSADPECTFLTYYEGRCEVFKNGEDVQDLASVSKAFSYSFEEQETSCPTAIVSRPQAPTTGPTTALKKFEYSCKDYPANYNNYRFFTKKNLFETPDKLFVCLFGYVSGNCGCTLKGLDFLRKDDYVRFYITDYSPNSPTAICADYNVDAPIAVAAYACKVTGQYVYVADTESGRNPEFPNFGDLERIESTPIFYVHDMDDCRSP